ncbi:MAG: mechanosensitive ion channel domain-containing protein [Nannocystaceae bacterium]
MKHQAPAPLRAAVVLVAAVLATLPAIASAAPEADLSSIGQIARLIRWSGVFTSMFVIGGAWLVMRFLRNTVAGLSKRFPNRRLLLQKVATFAQFTLYVGTGLAVVILSFELNDSIIALIGGTIAVSVGFAIKDLVASFIAGIMIMIDRPFQVGDRVSFGGEYGDITAIGLRSVRLQTLDDNTVTIPNNKFLNDMTSNGNYGALDMQVVMDFFIAPDQDVRRARDLCTECAVSSRYVFLDKPVVVLVNQVITDNYVAVRLRVKAYVLDTRFEKVFETDVNMRVMDAFGAEGIGPPAILVRNTAAPGKLGVAIEAARAG